MAVFSLKIAPKHDTKNFIRLFPLLRLKWADFRLRRHYAENEQERKLELSFFLNDRGRVAYNDLCRKCQHKCKQSFRAVM